MSAANRVIKNSIFLYIKMGITIFVSLYTTRLVLNCLGASDFGVFNLIGGAIGMLGFLNSTLANATQRFMSYAEGEGDNEKIKKVFNISILLHLIVAIITAIILLILMYPLFNKILNIEYNRIIAAKIIYISLIISTVLTIINVPYDAVMNAHENMLYYSIIGIFESFLKLLVAMICIHTSCDKLIMYGILMACIPLITLSIMKLYCHKHYAECDLHLIKYWDCFVVKKIASFSGWNFLTAISSLFTAQGLGLVLNHFFGTKLNASQGIAHQVNGQLSAFSVTMLKALNPIIVKSAGAKNINFMNETTIAGCKFSTLIILFFAVPIMLEMPYVLNFWLKNVPDWAIVFCRMQLINTVICQMATPAATAVYAQGDIKDYAIWKSMMNIIPIFITYICFTFGWSPIWLYVPMVVFWALGGDIIIIMYSHKKCGLQIKSYLVNVLYPIILISLIMTMMGAIIVYSCQYSLIRLILVCITTTIMFLTSTWFIGLNSLEKQILINLYKKLLCNVS